MSVRKPPVSTNRKTKKIGKSPVTTASLGAKKPLTQAMAQVERENNFARTERATNSLAQQTQDAISRANALANPPIDRLLGEASKLTAMSLAAERATNSLAQQTQDVISRADVFAPNRTATVQTSGLASAANAPRAAFPAPINRLSTRQEPQSVKIRSAKDIGILVKAARKRMKLSQQAFADTSGVGRRFISELEGGKPTLEFDKVMRVCAAAGIDVHAVDRSAK